ncbi:arginine repressor [Metaplanococcus flavidus]|uniref:Arginine repressor n=1 Tax=Metaplanococcus flavidus TaxID=569883 RepID=A0ABW3LAW7_9BACL
MNSNIDVTNKQRSKTKKARRNFIQNLLDTEKIFNQEDIKNALKQHGITASQSTVQRDLEYLGFKKNKNDGHFELSSQAKYQYTLDSLYDLLEDNNSAICSNVKTFIIKTNRGKAQEISMLIEEVFEEIVLKTIVDMDTVLIFADGDELSDDFQRVVNAGELLKN